MSQGKSVSENVTRVTMIWHVSLSEKNIKSGFKSTGIYPTDPTRYPTDRFDSQKYERFKKEHPSFFEKEHQDKTSPILKNSDEQPPQRSQSVSDLPTMTTNQSAASNPKITQKQCASPIVEPSFLPNDATTQVLGLHPNTEFYTSDHVEQPDTSQQAGPSGIIDNDPASQSEKQNVFCSISIDTVVSTSKQPNSTPKRKSFEELLLEKVTPKSTGKPKEKRSKIDVNAVVITSEQYIEQIRVKVQEQKEKEEAKANRLKEREKKKQEKEKKQKESEKIKRKTQKRESSSSSELDDDDFELLESSDGSLHFSEEESENTQTPTSHIDFPKTTRQIKLYLRNIKEKISELQLYAVYFETTFYIGQVQKLFYTNEENTPDNICDVEIKYLTWCGDDKFKWPIQKQIEVVKPGFFFYGPIETQSFDPFVIPATSDIRTLYYRIQKLRDDIFETKNQAVPKDL